MTDELPDERDDARPAHGDASREGDDVRTDVRRQAADPTDTAHPTGERQAAENEANDPPA